MQTNGTHRTTFRIVNHVPIEKWLRLARNRSALVRTAECGGVPTLRPIAEGVFALPVFTRRFCTLLCEELAHFAASGLPMGP